VLRASHPYGGLQFCPSAIQLLPYQLEPALAVFRHGALRLLVADDVGLGKTVEAGLIVRETTMRDRMARTLILSPASVRGQWRQELATLFDTAVVDADAAWLRRSASELPPDVNPWSLPGVYLASIDFVKRAEALHPLESVRWDLLVVDEAHAATPGSDRRAAVHALAARSRLLVLLTATPHSGDDEQFRALCATGAEGESPPMVFFNRTRADTQLGENQPRSRRLAVRLTDAERRTHRLLEEYTRRVWAESRQRADIHGELLATILRKRALSSPACLSLSIQRRVELLAGAPAAPAQLSLPLEDDGRVDEDRAPDWSLGGVGLRDGRGERELLMAIAAQAQLAGQDDSKLRVLLRLLRRVREPAIVFTEYRDTAEHLSQALRTAGHHVRVLHGGLSPNERGTTVAAFGSGDSILVATDAASEGLNLQHACRIVVHFELPWAPSRLRQRRGRVHRIGQQRRVHEVALVANDTCEQLVLVPLVQRALRSRAFGGTPLVDPFPESDVAAHVLGGVALADEAPAAPALPSYLRRLDLRRQSREEADRLAWLRRLAGARVAPSSNPGRRALLPIARSRRRWAGFEADLTLLVLIALRDRSGATFDLHPLIVSMDLDGFDWRRGKAHLRDQVLDVLAVVRPRIDVVVRRSVAERTAAVAPVRAVAAQAARARDEVMRQQLRSTARELVQSGLFDRRAMRATAARDRRREALLDHLDAHTSSQADDRPIEGTYEIRAVVVGAGA
jgi:superfamily II DNA or RNA helicase